MQNKLSIIIPVFNRVQLIQQTLNSIINQTYNNWECLLVDDGSTDGTQEILEKYTLKDSRFILIHRDREPKGAPTCRNIGLERSNGDYVIFFDSDDIFKSDCFFNRVNKFTTNPSYDALIFSGASFELDVKVSKEITRLGHGINDSTDYLRNYVLGNVNWITASPIWRREYINQYRWDEDIINWQDPEFHIRLLNNKLKFKVFQEIDWYYRVDRNYDSISKKRFTLSYLLNRKNTCTKIISYLNDDLTKLLFIKKQANFFFKEAEKFALDIDCKFEEVILLSNPFNYYSRFNAKLLKIYLFILHFLKLTKIPYVRGLVVSAFNFFNK
ncbi:glycosyltransferase family A protein [Flammeovirga sp. EKP202]|uniref:glycosyltransferase family 2 protein n=1 Tax=Flammeovirga sp. EKP202 TaxID=2770592 RepID=UPI00165F6FC5|nr:glycosyltransferase family A protein [Flammeovirga sp. EKP202]MBD0400834.1 glycosyltransferase family 2 protein [Flammeovirga sp. EKP202]